MKIAFVFGKGIDGCGVTRGAQIFENWVCENGIAETLIVDFDNAQAMHRAKNIKWKGKVLDVHFKDAEVSQEIIKAVNACDIAVIHSYPTRKQEAHYIERFRKFLEKVSDPIIVCHDHAVSKINMAMIPQANEYYSKADVFVPQSLDGEASRVLRSFDPGLEGRIIENPIWIDPTYLDSFRKPANEREKHFMYIGRQSPLKDPAMICRTRPYLQDWKMSFIGCERSISAITIPPNTPVEQCKNPYIPQYQPMIKFFRLNKNNEYVIIGEKERHKSDETSIFACDSYKFDFGMGKLGSSFASWCGYSLIDNDEYGSRMEYTMIESFLLSLPILNDLFVENAHSPEGKKWKEYDFLISSSCGKEKELADTLNRLWSNKKEWTERTKACQDLIYKFNSIDNLAPKYLKFIQQKGKRSNKVNAIEKISEYFDSAKERREKGEIIISTGNSIKNKTAMILVDGKQEEIKEAKSNSFGLASFFE